MYKYYVMRNNLHDELQLLTPLNICMRHGCVCACVHVCMCACVIHSNRPASGGTIPLSVSRSHPYNEKMLKKLSASIQNSYKIYFYC